MFIAIVVLLVLLQIADVVSTMRALSRNPRAEEGNPVMRWMMARLGRAGGLIVPKVVVLVPAVIGLGYAYTSDPTVALIALALICAGYVLVVVNNWQQA